MNSMTGFSRVTDRGNKADLELEVRSVNHRFLNVRVHLPEELSRFEAQIERMVRKAARRGTITVRLQVRRTSPVPDEARLKERAAAIQKLLKGMKKALRDATPVTLETVMAMPAFWSGLEDRSADAEAFWERMRPMLTRALKSLGRERGREGGMIRQELTRRLKMIGRLAASIQRLSPRVIDAYAARLKNRVETVVRAHGLNGARLELAKEIGIFADKCDVTEEISRLRFHQKQMRASLASREPLGRKLEFMAQEMTREANTLAAKANDARISSMAVEIKGEVEKIKEQAENLE